MKKLLKLNHSWMIDSWKKYHISQCPNWPVDKLKNVIELINSFPPLVPIHEIISLKKQLKNVASKKAFILLGGDCAETFADFKHELIENKLKIIFQMSLILSYNLQKPIIKIGRMAGQFAKPRSSMSEIKNKVILPCYMGDAVNSKEFDNKARTPNPDRLIKAYNQSAATLNLLRSLTEKDIYDIVSDFNSTKITKIERIKSSLSFVKSIHNREMYKYFFSKDFFTAHESLLLDYEASLTRQDNKGLWYSSSSHMVWLGYRTNYPDSAHIEFLSGVENPIGIKVGPETDLKALIYSIQKLNPKNEIGKIILILRFGIGTVENSIFELIHLIKNNSLNVLWMCDPMHGNTFKTKKGIKTREFDDIVNELKCFFKILKLNDIYSSGVHFELTSEDVTECVSESYNIRQSNMHERYETACDPRLNKKQSLDIATLITQLI
ncbi:MAG: 3-deoxy-7-phosphoheptulonate synthase class II [Candidatus Marinimicrobia bacterium]|nr:3-deoxy-7-phosphoheptulonate synthase class II [Candidatus Neomarinimicrobiota bacterium]|tara:strand:- start:11903 stop:13213 length:1311 start_codon:yes stop_codon:yes gene_type:complete